jgi:hypothetical protein
MTKQLHLLARKLQAKLVSLDDQRDALPVERDAWATLYRWHIAGEHVYRIRSDVPVPIMRPDLDLATAPVARAGVCYVIDRDQWMVIARHAAQEPIVVQAPDLVRAYSEPMLSYCSSIRVPRLERSGVVLRDVAVMVSGVLNLRDMPTPASLKMPPGTSLGADGVWRLLTAEDIAPEMVRLAKVLPWYYQP